MALLSLPFFFRHSHGRGGVGNLTADEVPHRENAGSPYGVNHPHSTHSHIAESHGRGGSGNISREPSREPGAKNPHNVLSGLLHSVTGGRKNEARGRSTDRGGELTT